MYCSGDLLMGGVTEPGPDQWGWAYFSGAHIIDGVIENLKVDTWPHTRTHTLRAYICAVLQALGK
jgi:hypothetical protein